MGIIILGFILLVVAIVLLEIYDSCISILVGFVIVALIVSLFPINKAICDIPTEDITPIYAGYNDSEIHGQFLLGSGTVNEHEMVYYWIDDNGVKSKQSVLMSKSVFIEDGKNMMVERYYTCPSNLKWFGSDNGGGVYEFHVPEGSIAAMYQYH